MKNISVVTGSARPNSAGKHLTKKVVDLVNKNGDAKPSVVDVAELNLPFMNALMPPSADGFSMEDDNVKKWSEIVKKSDAVIFMMPEYNHSLSAVQKNAIDWLYGEWRDKPVAVVAYGFYAGKHSLATFNEVNNVVKMNLLGSVGFTFGKELGMDGSITDADRVEKELDILLSKVLV